MPGSLTGVPTEEDVLGVLRRRGCLSLRAICVALWPRLRWRPLLLEEDSAAEGVLPEGKTRALWTWERLGMLLLKGCVRVAGHDPNEVDELAAVTFELLGPCRRQLWVLSTDEEKDEGRRAALMHRRDHAPR
jgi:hypothetical protein